MKRAIINKQLRTTIWMFKAYFYMMIIPSLPLDLEVNNSYDPYFSPQKWNRAKQTENWDDWNIVGRIFGVGEGGSIFCTLFFFANFISVLYLLAYLRACVHAYFLPFIDFREKNSIKYHLLKLTTLNIKLWNWSLIFMLFLLLEKV